MKRLIKIKLYTNNSSVNDYLYSFKKILVKYITLINLRLVTQHSTLDAMNLSYKRKLINEFYMKTGLWKFMIRFTSSKKDVIVKYVEINLIITQTLIKNETQHQCNGKCFTLNIIHKIATFIYTPPFYIFQCIFNDHPTFNIKSVILCIYLQIYGNTNSCLQ